MKDLRCSLDVIALMIQTLVPTLPDEVLKEICCFENAMYAKVKGDHDGLMK